MLFCLLLHAIILNHTARVNLDTDFQPEIGLILKKKKIKKPTAAEGFCFQLLKHSKGLP